MPRPLSEKREEVGVLGWGHKTQDQLSFLSLESAADITSSAVFTCRKPNQPLPSSPSLPLPPPTTESQQEKPSAGLQGFIQAVQPEHDLQATPTRKHAVNTLFTSQLLC